MSQLGQCPRWRLTGVSPPDQQPVGVVGQSVAAHPVAQVDQGRQVAAVPGGRDVHWAAGRRLHTAVRDQPSAAHPGRSWKPPPRLLQPSLNSGLTRGNVSITGVVGVEEQTWSRREGSRWQSVSTVGQEQSVGEFRSELLTCLLINGAANPIYSTEVKPLTNFLSCSLQYIVGIIQLSCVFCKIKAAHFLKNCF